MLETRKISSSFYKKKSLTSKNDIAATECISGPTSTEGTKKSANDEDGNDNSLNGTVLALGSTSVVDRIDLGKRLDPILLSQKTTNAGLVVTEQDKGWRDDKRELEPGQGLACDAEWCADHFFEYSGGREIRKEAS